MIRSLDGTYLSVSQCWNNDTINSILKKMRSGTKGLKDWQLNWTGMLRTRGKKNSSTIVLMISVNKINLARKSKRGLMKAKIKRKPI